MVWAPRQSSKYADLKRITSLHADYPGKPGFMGCYHHKSWSTHAAAEAAIPHFRAWVDDGRRKKTAAAATARGLGRARAARALQRAEQRQAHVRLENRAGCALVGLMLASTRWPTWSGWSRHTKATAARTCLIRSTAMLNDVWYMLFPNVISLYCCYKYT